MDKNFNVYMLLLHSILLAGYLSILCSALPMLTVSGRDTLFSTLPCYVHFLVSILSFWIWVSVFRFAQFRFQLSVGVRRSGLWTALSDDPSALSTRGGAEEWRPGRLYTRGETVRSAVDLFALSSYCSLSADSAPLIFCIYNNFLDGAYKFVAYLFAVADRVIFQALAAEVGPLKSSFVIDAALMSSAALAAIMSVAAFMSMKVTHVCTIFC